MDAGKVKVVLSALREELQTRRTTGAQSAVAAGDNAPVLPVHGSGAFDANSAHRDGSEQRQEAPASSSGVLVELSSEPSASGPERSVHLTRVAPEEPEHLGGPELSQRPIPEFVVPFFVPQEPLVVIAPYLVRAVLAAAAAGLLMLILL